MTKYCLLSIGAWVLLTVLLGSPVARAEDPPALLYFTHPATTDGNEGITVRPSIWSYDPEKGEVSQLVDFPIGFNDPEPKPRRPLAIAAGADGSLYWAESRFHSSGSSGELKSVHLMRRDADGVVKDLGMIIDTGPSFNFEPYPDDDGQLFWAPDLAVDDLGTVYFTHPATTDGNEGITVRPSIWSYDPEKGEVSQLVDFPIGFNDPEPKPRRPLAVAAGADGSLYWAESRFHSSGSSGELKSVHLMRRDADGVVKDLGMIIDTGPSFDFEPYPDDDGQLFWAPDLAVDDLGTVYFTHPATTDGNEGITVRPSIWSYDPEKGEVSQLVDFPIGFNDPEPKPRRPLAIAAGADGSLYWAESRFHSSGSSGELKSVHLMRRDADGVVKDLGMIIDTGPSFNFEPYPDDDGQLFWAPDLAITPGPPEEPEGDLPLKVGILTIDGDRLEPLGSNNSGKFRVSGHVTLNGILRISEPVEVDLKKNRADLAGFIAPIHPAVFYSLPVLFENAVFMQIEADTGEISLTKKGGKKVELKLNLAGIEAEVTRIVFFGSGIELGVRLSMPGLRIPSGSGRSKAKLRLNIEIPDLVLDKNGLRIRSGKVEVKNLFIAGTKWGIDTLSLGYDQAQPSVKKPDEFSGELMVRLPSGQAIGGSVKFLGGKLDKLTFDFEGRLPIFTSTAGVEATFLTRLNGTVDHLLDIEGREQPPSIGAGQFNRETGEILVPGFGIQWGPVPLVLAGVVPIEVVGAAELDAAWNVTLGGELRFFPHGSGRKMLMRRMVGSYENKPGGGVLRYRGALALSDLFELNTTLVGRQAPGDTYISGRGEGRSDLPLGHWARGFAGEFSGVVVVLMRAEPEVKFLTAFRATAKLPFLEDFFEKPSVSYQFNLLTGEFMDATDAELIGVLDGKALTRGGRENGPAKRLTLSVGASGASQEIVGGAGEKGLIVQIVSDQEVISFGLRLPDGTLLTSADADGVTSAYNEDPDTPQSVFLLKMAPDGVYSVEFDAGANSDWEVRFMTPKPASSVTVGLFNASDSLLRDDSLSVFYSTTNVDYD